MKSSIGMWFLASALVSALVIGACGADDDCDALCDRAAECDGEKVRSECMSQCESLNYPPEFIECAVELSCKPRESQVEACVKKVAPSKGCKVYCSGSCLEGGEVEDARLCASSCTMAFPAEVQACFAKIDGDTCEGLHACLGRENQPE